MGIQGRVYDKINGTLLNIKIHVKWKKEVWKAKEVGVWVGEWAGGKNTAGGLTNTGIV